MTTKRASEAEPPGEGSQALPEDHLYVVPVRNMVLFPGVVLPLMIGRRKSVQAIERAVELDRPVALLLQKEEAVEDPSADDLHRVGTVADIVRYITSPDGRHHAICQGEQRCRVLEFVSVDPLPIARIERLEEVAPEADDTELEGRFHALKERAKEVLQLAPGSPEDLSNAVENIESPGMLADMVATFLDVPVAERQQVLESFDVRARLDLVMTKLGRVAEVLRLSHKIREATKGTLEKAQREYYLREQLHAIQKELGEGDEKSSEVHELGLAIAAAGMPSEVEKEVQKELRRYQRMPEAAGEASVARTYVELMTELPWSKSTPDRLDLDLARRVLDQDHYGLEKVKRRVLEYLAVRKLKPGGKSPSLCLVGPPGVGKTSLGQSIARAMEREFVRVSLGGVHDEAEIRGHRRTYVGALPGNVVQGMRRAGVRNPVFMLDEMDKLGRGIHGDPASALLEVLDPEQNHSFRDNYLGVPFDLGAALFIGTANVLDSIPPALRDRFDVIHLPGYTEQEKLEIARRYLVARRSEESGLSAKQVRITDEALRAIVRRYTREAGVRNLERHIGALCRHVATLIASGERRSMKIDRRHLAAILGAPRYESELAMRTCVPGVATGLAWTAAGGEILFIESTAMPGKGRLTLTGQLGDVMKESAQTALSLVRTRARKLGIDPAGFEARDIHMHLPAGAIPKDGPSAGLGLYASLVSLLTGRCARSDVALTGEISLRGLVLGVGGIKEKVLGALAAGIGTVVLPRRNRSDVEEIPVSARGRLEFVLVERVEQALAVALEPAPGAPIRKGGKSRRTDRSRKPSRRSERRSR